MEARRRRNPRARANCARGGRTRRNAPIDVVAIAAARSSVTGPARGRHVDRAKHIDDQQKVAKTARIKIDDWHFGHAGPRGPKRTLSTAPKHVRPSSLSAARDAGTSTPRSMSRRYATLPSLMTGRGGVHEVASERLAAVPADELEGIAHPVLFREDDTADAADAADRHDRHDRHDRLSPHDFESHVEYPLHNPSLEDPDAARSLHVLRLRPRLARRILEDLIPRAEANARRGYDALERLVHGPEGGVVVSNVGGYQSSHDLLEPNTWCYTSDEDEDGDGDDGEDNGDGDATAPPPPPPTTSKGWGLLSAAACAAHERVRDENRGERAITLEDLYGWLNANEGGDFNKLHEHGGADSWSGVFYLRCPPPAKPPSSDSDSDSDSDSENAYGVGTLGLRCHEPAGSTSEAAVPYLRYAPRAGDLLLFRGDVLHAVESNGWARGGAGREARDVDMQTVRLSVAFNEDSLANDKKVAERRGEVGK